LVSSILPSKRIYGEKRNTKIHLADCEIYKKKVKMERKEIQLAKGDRCRQAPRPVTGEGGAERSGKST